MNKSLIVFVDASGIVSYFLETGPVVAITDEIHNEPKVLDAAVTNISS